MANLDTMETSTLTADGCILRSSSVKGSGNVCFDSASDEDLLIKDLDSYWDDLNARLTVSRMVNESIIRGMVNAVVQEAAENISSKEAEVARLNARLQFYESDVFKHRESGLGPIQLRPKSEVQSSCSGCSVGNTGYLDSLRIAAEKHLQMLKNELKNMQRSNSYRMMASTYENICAHKQGNRLDPLTKMEKGVDALGILLMTMCEHGDKTISSLKESLYELQWQWKFEKEVDTIIFQSFIGEARADFEMKLHKRHSHINTQNRYQQGKVDELSNLRHELDSISKSILSTEAEHTSFNTFYETFEEWDNNKGKDNFPQSGLENNLVIDTSHVEESGLDSVGKSRITYPEIADTSLILRMSEEDLANHYKTELNNVERQLESSLHEKTEELFKLKREFLKEKGSLQCRRENDFESFKKKFLEIIVKFDKILFEAENCSMFQVHHDQTCTYEQRIDRLLLDNQCLHDFLADKRKEVKCLSSIVSDAANQMSNCSSTEGNFLKKMTKVKWEIEDVKMETFIGNQIEKCLLSELISEVKSELVDVQMSKAMVEEFYGIILREKNLDLETEKSENLKQVASLTALVNEKERALLLEVKESEKLKQEIVSLLALIEEKNEIASEAESKLEQQKEHFDKVFQELNLLKDQACDQWKLLSDDGKESKFLKARLDEASDQIHLYKAKVCEVTEKLMTVSSDLEEAGKQKAVLHEIIQEKENEIFSAILRSDELMVQMESVVTFNQELSKSVAEFQSTILGNLQRKSSRLAMLSYQFDSLAKQVDILRRRELWYREKFEIRSFDLKKAETEVDLLGDEVDSLLDILGKIYVALDYYSPVLQHYHGVMEILKLVRRELRGTS